MKQLRSNYYCRGQSLIEMLIAMGILGVMLPAIFSGFVSTRQGRVQQEQRLDATYLIQEGVEAVRMVRESGWSNFSQNGIYHPVKQSNAWTLVAGSETLNNLTRQITISDAQRNSSGQIVSSGGSNDPSTKRVDISVSWDVPSSSTVSSTIFLTRYLENIAYEETTVADFERGETLGTAIVNNNGGEIILGAGGTGDWCNPFDSQEAQMNLPGQGIANAISAREGRVLVGTGANASGVALADITVSNDNPPQLNLIRTIDGYKTNDVFTQEGYSYIATDNGAREVIIVDTPANESSSLMEIGHLNGTGNSNGNGVFVLGNRAYMVNSSGSFFIFDVSSKNGEKTPIGSLALPSVGKRLMVVGDYAYVATTGSQELQIINVSNPSSPQIVGYADVNGNGGVDVFVNGIGTRAYIVTNQSATQAEFFILNIENKSGAMPVIGTYQTGAMNPKALTVVPGNRVILAGHNGEQYQVLTIVNESTPTRCGGLTYSGFNINGLESVSEADGDTYAYIMTSDSNYELRVIRGGPGGQTLAGGEFFSGIFDPGVSTAFNRFTTDFVLVNDTDMQFQIAIADPVAGSCTGADYVFVGPDGTDTTFYGTAGVIPFDDDGVGYENPGRCFRYRAIFETADISWTPILNSIRVNYSP